MNSKFFLGTAIAAALAFGASTASACQISAWSSATGLTVADTGEPSAGFARYSGRCSLRVNAGSKFVQDNTPADEASYRVRFYYFTGDISGGEVDIFRARSSTPTNIVRVTHDGNLIRFYTNTGGAAQSVTVADNRYYAVEINWAAATTAGGTNGSMTASVTGNGGNLAGTATFNSLSNGNDRITDAQMGLITAATVANPVYFDEFDSRRTTSPGRLCRGDANGNGTLTGGDAQAVINEVVNGVIALGQPDCNESGTMTGGDAQCVIGLVTGGASCS